MRDELIDDVHGIYIELIGIGDELHTMNKLLYVLASSAARSSAERDMLKDAEADLNPHPQA